MNSSGELTGFTAGLDRYEKKIAREEELDKLKQEILDRAKLETHDIVKQKTTEIEKEIMSYLKPVGTMEKDVHKIKNSMVTKKEMAEFFEKFLNEFSHIIDGIEDTETKGLFTGFKENMSKTVNALKKG
jgi:hypothetical protein